MKLTTAFGACLALVGHAVAESSAVILPSTFKPPQVFKNANLVHLISLEKGYAREWINVVVDNISPEPQDEYFLPFTSSQMASIGSLEVKDKKDESVSGFGVDRVEFDPESDTQYIRIRLPTPLASKSQQVLAISFSLLDSVKASPAAIAQTDKQFLSFGFSAYCNSAYPTVKQKTEVKLPTSNVPDFTQINDKNPEKQGSKLTYGPFSELPAGAVSPASVRYEFNNPVTYISQLERDVEVSHWGGNVAFEERYALFHHGANLTSQFNRVKWAQSMYFNPVTSALKELKFPLAVGSQDAYFTDAVGNVSTSRFRSNKREAMLEIKPRYPIFGGWKYPFTIGWNSAARNFVKKTSGDTYLLKVPFLEGPKQAEGVQYGQAQIRVLLPEGADNVKFYTTIPESSITEHTIDLQKTYLDTVGRTVLTIKAQNLSDDLRNRELIVSYDYSFASSLRKPLVIFSSMMALFTGIWLISKVDVKFSTK